MHFIHALVAIFTICGTLLGSNAQVTTSCNPLDGLCSNDKGLASSLYSVDFTSLKDIPTEWVLAKDEKVNFGAQGAELTFSKRYDAPTMHLDQYFFFGRVEYVVKAAPGTGIISSMVLLSDDLDEVDWEFRGGVTDSVQTNYFGKGFTGTYNRSTTVPIIAPQAGFHTYAVDWSPNSLVWSIDGKIVRTLNAADTDGNGSQYPQTPMKVSLSLWDGGDPDTNSGTVDWAGGLTPLPPPEPYSMYVKSVKVWNSNPGQQYQYTDKSGSWKSIKVVNDTMTSSSSVVVKTLQTLSLGPTSSGSAFSSPAQPAASAMSNTTGSCKTEAPISITSSIQSTAMSGNATSLSRSPVVSAILSPALTQPSVVSPSHVSSSCSSTSSMSVRYSNYSTITQTPYILTSSTSAESSSPSSSFLTPSTGMPISSITSPYPGSSSVSTLSSMKLTVSSSAIAIPSSSPIPVSSSSSASSCQGTGSTSTQSSTRPKLTFNNTVAMTISAVASSTQSESTPITSSSDLAAQVSQTTNQPSISSTSSVDTPATFATTSPAPDATLGSSSQFPSTSNNAGSPIPSVAADLATSTCTSSITSTLTISVLDATSTSTPTNTTAISPTVSSTDSSANAVYIGDSNGPAVDGASTGTPATATDSPYNGDSDSAADDDTITIPDDTTDAGNDDLSTIEPDEAGATTSSSANMGTAVALYPYLSGSLTSAGGTGTAASTGFYETGSGYPRASASPLPYSTGDAQQFGVDLHMTVIAGAIIGLSLAL